MQINDDMEKGAGTAVGEVTKQTALQQANQGFAGLGTMGFAKRVVIDGTQLLFKESGVAVDSLAVKFTGGRMVKQMFIEESNVFIKSYDGNLTTDGEPVSMYPGLKNCFELDFPYYNETDGDEVAHQMVLSPTGAYAFDDYAKALLKIGKGISDVETIITAVRAENKSKIRYSKPQFTCKELLEIKAA